MIEIMKGIFQKEPHQLVTYHKAFCHRTELVGLQTPNLIENVKSGVQTF